MVAFHYIVVENGDYLRNGELYLIHGFEGTELDSHYLENVLPYIYQLWGRIVHIETMLRISQLFTHMMGKKYTDVMFKRSKRLAVMIRGR